MHNLGLNVYAKTTLLCFEYRAPSLKVTRCPCSQNHMKIAYLIQG